MRCKDAPTDTAMSPLQSLRGLQVPLSLAEASAHHPALTPSERWTEAGTKRLFPTIVIQAVRLLCAFHTSEGSTNPSSSPSCYTALPFSFPHAPWPYPQLRTHTHAFMHPTFFCHSGCDISIFLALSQKMYTDTSSCCMECLLTPHLYLPLISFDRVSVLFFFARLLRWSTIVASQATVQV
jgi:hypothetical protein